ATEASTELAGVEAAAGAAEDPAALVVLLALVGLVDQVVSALNLLEALLGVRVAGVLVRVVLARELAVGLLDLVLRGLLVDAENLVRILDSHQALTITLAGRMTLSPSL